jgi:pimeloyl-ACP methyl ester carboxylesterase
MPKTQKTLTASTRLGPIPYRVFGTGPVTVVAVQGLLADGRLWDGVAERLAADATVIVPDFPFGAHRAPVPDPAQLSPERVAEAFVDLLDALELPTAVLLGNDTGGALCQIAASIHPDRFTALALTSCDSFENFPPRFFQPIAKISHLPGVARAVAWTFSLPPLLARPGPLNLLAARPIPGELVRDWMRPARIDSGVRRDLSVWMRSLHPRYALAAAERLRHYPGPVVLAWSRRDRVFPPAHAERLAGVFPRARIVWIDGALTFSPLDQPQAVAEAVRGLLAEVG